jgi:large subunit ribosomal protein L17
MRHGRLTNKLGRKSAHRNAMLANLVCNLIIRSRVRTTLDKAKAARRLAEQMVTLAKKGTLAARRQAIAELRQKEAVGELFKSIAAATAARKGGYTRILKLGRRISDSAEQVLLEWVDIKPVEKKSKPEDEKTKKPEGEGEKK